MLWWILSPPFDINERQAMRCIELLKIVLVVYMKTLIRKKIFMTKFISVESFFRINERVCNVAQESGPSISEYSKIFYETAVTETGTQLIRLMSSSGRGVCGNKWYSVHELLELLDAAGNTFCSRALIQVFPDESNNNAGFMLAALWNEGYVQKLPGQVPWKPHTPILYILSVKAGLVA